MYTKVYLCVCIKMCIVDEKLSSQSKERNGKFYSGQTEDYNPVIASEKALKTVLPIKGQSTVV